MVAWNPADKNASITLSGGNLVATGGSSSNSSVRGDTSFASGKVYYEATMTAIVGNSWGIGFGNSGMSLSSFVGAGSGSIGFYPSQSGIAILNGSVINTEYTGATGQTICIAFDITNKLIWFRYGGDYWNGSPTADPASGTGGLNLSTISAGPYFPAVNFNGSGSICTANFGAKDFAYAIPSGFSGLDTNVQAYEASSKFLAYDILSPPIDAISISKVIAYDVLSPPIDAIAASKFISYTILQDVSKVRLTQAQIKVLRDGTPAARVTQMMVKVLRSTKVQVLPPQRRRKYKQPVYRR